MVSGISEKNRRLLDLLSRSFKGSYSIQEAVDILNIPEDEVRIKLAYLARKGWLSRVKQGLYISVPLGTINPKEYREHPWIVANRLYDPCYVGGWSAAEHWEFTDQIFNSIVVFTLRKFKNKHVVVQGTSYILKHVNKKYFGKIKSVWVENTKISVSDPVQTIVDILDDPSIGGGIRHAADIVKCYFSSDHRNDSLIRSYIRTRNNKTIYKRLGYLIEALGIDARDLLNDCKTNVSTGYTLLDPSIESMGPYNSQWNLRINGGIHP